MAHRSLILVEDNPRDREFLASVLDQQWQGELRMAEDAGSALELTQSEPDAYLICDIQLPDMSGVELAKRIWSANPNTRIVFWSQYDDELYVRSLDRVTPVGTAFGYVLKSSNSTLLLHALDIVFQENQRWIDPQVRDIQARSQTRHSLISDAEYEVLFDIALGLTDQLIAKRRSLSRRGVQSRLKSLYEKLQVDRALAGDGINPRSRAVAIALQRGLINRHELEQAERTFASWMQAQEQDQS